MEIETQAAWELNKTHQVNAPDVTGTASKVDVHQKHPKYMATFPYPYMNGRLHLGHAFTLSKAEFAVRFERMMGKRVLFPMGFHCTGMPIKVLSYYNYWLVQIN